MKRHDFIKKGVIAGVGGAILTSAACRPKEKDAISAPHIITDKKYQWKMVTTWPPNFPVVGTGCIELAQWIKTMSAGRLEIKVYGGGELVPALQVFEAVNSGAVEMGHGASYYWAGVEPAFQFFASIPFGMNAQQMNAWFEFGGGQELWEEIYSLYNIIPFKAGNTGVQMGGWFNKEISSMESWKGLKMRMPGLGAKVIERAGATAVLSPGSELYTNLERGVIDATEWIGPYHDYLMGFHDIAKYYYYPGWHEPGSVLEVMINKRDFEELPLDLQEIVRSACYRGNQRILLEFEAKNFEYLKKIRQETKVEIRPFPQEVMEGMRAITLDIYRDMIEKDPVSRKVYDSFSAFQQDITAWSQRSESAFHAQIAGS